MAKLPGHMKLVRMERGASGSLNAVIRLRRWHPRVWAMVIKAVFWAMVIKAAAWRMTRGDAVDADIAAKRLAEIEAHPERVLRGEALKERLKQWEDG